MGEEAKAQKWAWLEKCCEGDAHYTEECRKSHEEQTLLWIVNYTEEIK